MRAIPKEEEFTVSEDRVVHMPTGYTLMPSGDDPSVGHERPANVGDKLDDGRDYRPHEVREMAAKMWIESRRK